MKEIKKKDNVSDSLSCIGCNIFLHVLYSLFILKSSTLYCPSGIMSLVFMLDIEHFVLRSGYLA